MRSGQVSLLRVKWTLNVVLLYDRCVILFFNIFSCMSKSGPTHSRSDTNPVCNTGDLSPPPRRVPAAFLQSRPGLHPGNGLRRRLSDPTQRQRRVIGGRRFETCTYPRRARRLREQLGSQSRL